MSNLNPPPQTADANLDRWLNLLHKRVIAPVVTVGQLGNYTDDAAAAGLHDVQEGRDPTRYIL